MHVTVRMLFGETSPVRSQDSRQGVDDTNEESWNDPNFFDEEASESYRKIDSVRGSVMQQL